MANYIVFVDTFRNELIKYDLYIYIYICWPFQMAPFAMRCCSTCDSTATACGENVYRGSQKVPWKYAIMRWHSEVKDYSYDMRRSFNGKVTGHYTQVHRCHARPGRLTLNQSVQYLKEIAEWAPHLMFCGFLRLFGTIQTWLVVEWPTAPIWNTSTTTCASTAPRKYTTSLKLS